MTLRDLVSMPQNHDISTSMIQRFHLGLRKPNRYCEYAHSYALKNLKLLFQRYVYSKLEMGQEVFEGV
jgi:hypothetical protein